LQQFIEVKLDDVFELALWIPEPGGFGACSAEEIVWFGEPPA